MSNLKKILIAICVLALLTVGCVVWALADDGETEENVGSVAELSELITVAERATDVSAKHKKILEISVYLETKIIDTTEEGYDDCILRLNAACVEVAESYLYSIPEDIEADGVDIEKVVDAFMNADEVLRLYEIPDGTAGFSAVKVKYDTYLVKVASSLVKNIGTEIQNEENPKTAANKIKLNKAGRILDYCTPFGEIDNISDIRTKYLESVAAHEAAVAKNLAALDNKNSASSYDLPLYYSEDWEKKAVGYNVGTLTGWSYNSNGATANRVGVLQEKNGNKYYIHEYLEKDNPAGSFIQRGLTGYNSENGLVFEFSIATFSEVPKEGILVETGSLNGRFPPPYFYINGNGDICSNDKSAVLVEGALVRGGWIDIIIALDPSDFVYKLYVEGEYIATYEAKFDDGSVYDHSKVAFRLSGGPSTQGDVAYDNFKIYAGNNYRNLDRLNGMSETEKFVYFVDAFLDDSSLVLDRKSAHDMATELLYKYCTITDQATGEYEYTELIMPGEPVNEDDLSEEVKASVRAAVDKYMSFDIDSLVGAAKLEKLAGYVELVEEFRDLGRSPSNVTTRKNKINEIQDFLKNAEGLIDLEADLRDASADTEEGKNTPNGAADYSEYNTLYNTLVKNNEYDEYASQFVTYMTRFNSATTLAATERYYKFAKALITEGLIDLDLILNEGTPYRDNFKDLIDAYDTYVNSKEKVDRVSKEGNAKKIVQCMDKISQFRTEEQWEANAEVMNEYLNIVKDIILGTDADGNLLYDEKHEGIDESVRFFMRAYSYFYTKLQYEHIAYISDILDRISATNDYVEKIGLIALIDRYVDTNDIDYENAEIIVLLDNLDTCKSELELRSEDYSKVLEQNSGYFINYVEKMRTANTYADQVANFEAAALLYFSLDTTVPGTFEAIDTYDEYKVRLEKIKESSVKFLETVSIYNACETADDKYAALVECYYNAQFAELTYEGVSEAMAEYQAAYDAYVAYANAVNSDMTDTVNAVGSFRTNSGITTVIAVIIKKIFGI